MKKFKTDRFDIAIFLIASGKKLLGISGGIHNPQFVFIHDNDIIKKHNQFTDTSGDLKYSSVIQAREYLTKEFDRFVLSRRHNIILARDYNGSIK